jgi:hypothetical protein
VEKVKKKPAREKKRTTLLWRKIMKRLTRGKKGTALLWIKVMKNLAREKKGQLCCGEGKEETRERQEKN